MPPAAHWEGFDPAARPPNGARSISWRSVKPAKRGGQIDCAWLKVSGSVISESSSTLPDSIAKTFFGLTASEMDRQLVVCGGDIDGEGNVDGGYEHSVGFRINAGKYKLTGLAPLLAVEPGAAARGGDKVAAGSWLAWARLPDGRIAAYVFPPSSSAAELLERRPSDEEDEDNGDGDAEPGGAGQQRLDRKSRSKRQHSKPPDATPGQQETETQVRGGAGRLQGAGAQHPAQRSRERHDRLRQLQRGTESAEDADAAEALLFVAGGQQEQQRPAKVSKGKEEAAMLQARRQGQAQRVEVERQARDDRIAARQRGGGGPEALLVHPLHEQVGPAALSKESMHRAAAGGAGKAGQPAGKRQTADEQRKRKRAGPATRPQQPRREGAEQQLEQDRTAEPAECGAANTAGGQVQQAGAQREQDVDAGGQSGEGGTPHLVQESPSRLAAMLQEPVHGAHGSAGEADPLLIAARRVTGYLEGEAAAGRLGEDIVAAAVKCGLLSGGCRDVAGPSQPRASAQGMHPRQQAALSIEPQWEQLRAEERQRLRRLPRSLLRVMSEVLDERRCLVLGDYLLKQGLVDFLDLMYVNEAELSTVPGMTNLLTNKFYAHWELAAYEEHYWAGWRCRASNWALDPRYNEQE